ncbi:hypothetical protein BI347_07765 [Chromobacterium sphagni]|uniref:Acyl-homoserine-lactone synthase n=2 Tax=Chromobacterium sphagni TaxID=1903179 RepID=A0A1S1X1L6_9NEIS|nr:hypothetical protein BI347_07765 [Chromobacterium sphagni]OHX21878.1 hypothetical protein BI344_05075 [Chromobacterium sphagni]
MDLPVLDFQIAQQAQLPVIDLENMLRLRARIFRDRMGWDVRVENGMERDGYDELDPHYLLMKRRDGGLQGCMRLLPTLGPNMLRDVFPALLAGRAVPADRHTWEVSRFAVDPCGPCRQHADRLEHIRAALHHLCGFAGRHDIHRFVMVTTPTVQRMLHQLDVEAEVCGARTRFGIDEAVVLSVALSPANLRAVAPLHFPILPMPAALPARVWL